MQYNLVNERRGAILNDFMLLMRQKNSQLWDELIKNYNQSQSRMMNSVGTKRKMEQMFVYNSLLQTLTIADDYRYSAEFREAHERSGIQFDRYIKEVRQLATDYEAVLRE